MLKTRIITACALLLGLAVVLLVLPFHAFAVVVTVVFLLAAGEWANMVGLLKRWQQAIYMGCIAAIMLLLFGLGAHHAGLLLKIILILAAAGWFFALLAVNRYPNGKIWHRQPVLCLLGFWLLLPAWLGLLFLQPLVVHSGLVWLIIAVIAAADIGAYFAGRRFGKRKLAEQVSPGKTQEGFWGGLCANSVLAILLACWLGLNIWSAVCFVVSILLVSCVSVVGDLFESMVKREGGIKDSSQLLPGHGGVLDRIDGWTAAIPVFSLLYILGFVL